MGFSIGKTFKKAFSKITGKNVLKSYFGSAGFMLPGIGEATMFSDKFKNTYENVGKGLGNLVSGGYISQQKAVDEAEKAREQAQKQYAAEQAALQAAADETARLEEEKKKKLIAAGQKNPDTLYGSYTGLPGSANVMRNFLG